MRTPARIVIFLLGASGAVSTTRVEAQDTAASESLFKKGVAQMKQGNYSVACPALRESQRLDPYPGTMFALAECEAGWGHTATAVAHYGDYLGLVSHLDATGKKRHDVRVKVAQEKLEKLRPLVPRLSIVLPESAPKNTVVKRDGIVLKGASFGAPLPVDPGEHILVTQAPDGTRHEQKITINPGETKRVAVEVPLGNQNGPSPVNIDPANIDSGRTSPGPSTWAYVAGGIGVLGLATGSVAGLVSMSKKKTVDVNCDGSSCNDEGKSAADEGKTLGNISTIGFGVGIVGVATGVILMLSTPKTDESNNVGWQPSAFASSDGALVGLHTRW